MKGSKASLPALAIGRSPKLSRNRTIAMIVFIAALLAVAGLSIYTQIDRVATSTSAEQTAAKTQRSGPISTFPASWTSFCDPKVKGNTTTKSNLSNVTYPDLWNTTTVVHLAQVYQTIVDS